MTERDPSTVIDLHAAGAVEGLAELLHFGTAIETWGDGTASEFLEVVVSLINCGDASPRSPACAL